MTAPDLHTRLLAAVQQRMDVARAATPGPWVSVHAASEQPSYLTASDGRALAEIGDPFDAGFIAANDPATVIRHRQADLAILELHIRIPGDGVNFTLAEQVRAEEVIAALAAAYGVDVDG